MARRYSGSAAEGAVLFLEKVSPALEHVDSSSGSIGAAVNHAIEEFVSIIAKAPLDLGRRATWLERLWDAYVADAIPYIETLGECWGELCVTRELASIWADNLVDLLRANWSDHKPVFVRTSRERRFACLRCCRRDAIWTCGICFEKAPFVWWGERRWGARRRWSRWARPTTLCAMLKPRAGATTTRR